MKPTLFSIGMVFSLLGLPAIAGAQDRDGGVAANPAGPDGVAEEAPTRLMCGGEEICALHTRQDTRLTAVERRVSALQAAAEAAAARRRAAAAQPPRAGFVPLPTRVRRIEEVTVATAQALEVVVRDMPTLLDLNTQCSIRRNNPAHVLPPGTDCEEVARQLRELQATAARPATQATATIRTAQLALTPSR